MPMNQSWNQDFQDKYQQPQIHRWHHHNGRKWRGTKEPLDEGEWGEWKAGLKLNIQSTKIKASTSIISWQIDGGKVETVADFIFLGSKITADGNCSHEIKRCLLLGRKGYDKLTQCTKKQRHQFTNKIPYIQSYGVFSTHAWIWELDHKEGWIPMNWHFWILMLEKTLLRVPCTVRRSNHSTLKEINPT